MSKPDFSGFVEEIQENRWQVYGLELWQDGKLEAAYGDTQDTRYPVYSVTKSMVSIAVGMASGDGLLNINDSVLQYLPEKYVQAMSAQQQKVYEQITLQRLIGQY